MHSKAPRQPARLWQRQARGALLVLSLWLGWLGVAEACRISPYRLGLANGSFVLAPGCNSINCPGRAISAAWYSHETSRYPHGVLGDTIEYTRLSVQSNDSSVDSCSTKSAHLDEIHVFEDIAPGIVDLDRDQIAEIITVRSHAEKGAQLAIYTDQGGFGLQLIAATPYIGKKNRWLAPIGAADLDGDGYIEIAYIDRPHLAKTLRIWRFKDDELVEIASLPGLTNHKIGEDFISGGIRHCTDHPELILASADWSRIIAVAYDDEWKTSDLGPLDNRAALTSALNC